MKKALILFVGVCLAANAAVAVTIKKAAPVATKSTSAAESGGNMLTTVVGLVAQVQQLNAQQKELSAECEPSSAEIDWVNNIVKEYAKTGAITADEAGKKLGMKRCAAASGGYARQMAFADATETSELICYDWFDADGTVWHKFPMASIAKYCSDGSSSCSNKITKSNIYDIFNLVGFTQEDYTKSELTMASKLIDKIEKCSSAKLSARKKQLWGEFLTGAIGGVGQKTNSATIMQSVQGIAASGGGIGGMSSLGGLATQLLDK